MRGVPVLASDSGYYPRSGMLPLARSSRHSNLRPQFAEIMPAILWLQRMVVHYSIEPGRITSRDSKKNYRSFEGDETIQPAHETIGKRTTTLVPPPGLLRMSSSEPMFFARARIFANPNP